MDPGLRREDDLKIDAIGQPSQQTLGTSGSIYLSGHCLIGLVRHPGADQGGGIGDGLGGQDADPQLALGVGDGIGIDHAEDAGEQGEEHQQFLALFRDGAGVAWWAAGRVVVVEFVWGGVQLSWGVGKGGGVNRRIRNTRNKKMDRRI